MCQFAFSNFPKSHVLGRNSIIQKLSILGISRGTWKLLKKREDASCVQKTFMQCQCGRSGCRSGGSQITPWHALALTKLTQACGAQHATVLPAHPRPTAQGSTGCADEPEMLGSLWWPWRLGLATPASQHKAFCRGIRGGMGNFQTHERAQLLGGTI